MPATAVTQFFGIILLLGICIPVWSDTLTVTLDGLDPDLQTHTLSYLAIAAERERAELLPGRLQRLHARAPEQIKTALQVFGFYRASVTGELKKTFEGWEAVYTIDRGVPIPIGELDVVIDGDGEQDEILQHWLAHLSLQAGQPFTHPGYELMRDELMQLVLDRGYLDANLTRREVAVDLQRYVANITLHMTTGKRFRFGEVRFSESPMTPRLLNSYVKFKPGDPYSPSELLKLQTDLSGSGYFQSVEVRPDRQAEEQNQDDQIPVDILLQPRLPRQWRLGLGYATDTGPRVSVDHDRLMDADGHKLISRLVVSEKLREIRAAYVIPLQDPTREQLGFGAQYSNEITDTRNSHITGTYINYTSIWHNWQRSFGLNLERETYTVADDPEVTTQVFYPSVRFYRIYREDAQRTQHGTRIQAEVRGAREEVLSDTSYAQLRTGLKWITSLGANARFITRGDFGTTGVSDLDKLPASQRFFAGGDNSVRGYAYEELGPKNDAGEVVGGKHLLVGSVEVEQRLVGNWSVAAFYDVGNAINSFGDELASGAGAGLRWNSPVGPVRFDFAWALEKTEDRFRLHIVLGPYL